MNQPVNLRISLVQCSLVDLDVEANIHQIERFVASLQGSTDLAVFPEACLTGFSDVAMLQTTDWTDNPYIHRLQSISLSYGVAICGSIFVKDLGRQVNRCFLIDGDDLQWQDKRHLFRLGGEHKAMDAAVERRFFSFRGWRILPIVCYDLRFPVWCRCVGNDYDLILCVANWPEGRRKVWSTLLEARAMENLAYVVGVNRIGSDVSGLSYAGDSVLISPRGEVLASCAPYTEAIAQYEVSYQPLSDLRRKFPVWMDADDFLINH